MLHAVTIFWVSRTVWLSYIFAISLEGYRTKIGTVRHSSVPIPTSVVNKARREKRKRKEKKRKKEKRKGKEKKKVGGLRIQYMFFNGGKAQKKVRDAEPTLLVGMQFNDVIIPLVCFCNMRNARRQPPPRLQLVALPRVYFEIEDVRPDENQGQENSAAIFETRTPGGISIPKELNQNILQFLTGKDLLRFARVSLVIHRVVKMSKTLLFDAIRERIDEFADPNRGRQVNLQRFRKFNRVRIDGNGGWINGYCVRVTPKHVNFVRSHKIFDRDPTLRG